MNRDQLNFYPGSFLDQISPLGWEALARLWVISYHKMDEFLITADDSENDIFFILQGAATATSYTSNGREVSFISLKDGDCFGEFSAIDGSARSSNVVALKDCVAARLSAEAFRGVLKSQPDVSFVLLTVLVQHLRKISQRVIDFTTKSADSRLREALLDLALRHCDGADFALVTKPPTQYHLATYIFSSREAVAREMGRMRKAGVLTRDKRSLYFPSIAKLQSYVAEA